MRRLTASEQANLIQLVDSYGLTGVLDHLAIICSERADGISGTFQDEACAETWRLCSGECYKAGSAALFLLDGVKR